MFKVAICKCYKGPLIIFGCVFMVTGVCVSVGLQSESVREDGVDFFWTLCCTFLWQQARFQSFVNHGS